MKKTNMKKAKNKSEEKWLYIVIIIFSILFLTMAVFEIWIFVTYKDTPIKDVPYWVWWFLPGRN